VSIYTKTGDDGTTALFGGKRIPKYDDRVEVYGSIDELTSYIGLIISKVENTQDKKFLTDIQTDLYQAMSVLAGYALPLDRLEKQIKDFENYIDQLDKTLPKLTKFILPQGSEIASLFQIVRTIARRVERMTVKLFDTDHSIKKESKEIIMKHLNRLSDLFFIMGRKYNKEHEIVLMKGERVDKYCHSDPESSGEESR
jgi:cob(I)alamin adenosyltransferase